MTTLHLSVIIITKDAASHIQQCLTSVSWADEIIVLDSGSRDNTLEICRQYTDKVFINTDWQGFGVQKNRALSFAQGEWVLAIDADEEISLVLQHTLQQAMHQSVYTAFQIPRLSRFLGRWMHHSGWYPDYVIRLFRRGCARFSDDLVHEQVQILQGTVGSLDVPLLHYPYDRLEQVLDKANAYSSAAAHMRYARGQSGSLLKALGHGLWTFLRTYIGRAGFLDGKEGFILAVSNAEGVYYRYLKLMYLHAQHQPHRHDL